MKKLFLLMLTIILAISSFSQDTSAMATKKEYYLQKSKNQRTTGWVLLAGGTTIGIIGIISISNSNELDLSTSSDDNGVTNGSIMFLVGIAADLASIPFFISAGHYKKIATEISFGTQRIYLPVYSNNTLKYSPALSIKIGLGRSGK